MKNFNKKLVIFAAFIAGVSFVLPAEKLSKPWWVCCAHISESSDKKNRRAALAPIRALQDAAADKNCVRMYNPDKDYDQAHKVLQESSLGYYLKMKTCDALVYEKDSKILGACVFDPSTGYLQALSVSRDSRHAKIGSALMYATMNTLYETHNINNITLLSYASAIPFYKKLGFSFEDRKGTLSFV